MNSGVETESNISVSHEILKSAKWNTISLAVTYGSLFVNLIVLGRFVEPSEHGRAAVAIGITAFFMLFSQFGCGQAIIAHKDINKRFIDTMFTFSSLLAVILYGIVFSIAPFIAKFYNDALLTILLRIGALGILFLLVVATPLAIIQKVLFYKKQTAIAICTSVTNLIATFFLAIKGFGIWALILPAFAGNLIGGLMAFYLSKYKPSFVLCLEDLKKGMNFGISGLVSNVSNYVCGNIVQVVMGTVWTPATLGFYSFAEKQYSKPSEIIITQLTGALFPIFSKISDDLKRVKRAYLKIVRLGFFLISPVYSILMVGAPFIFGFLFGPQWERAVFPFQLFCILAYIRTLCIGSTGILSALKVPHWNAIIVSIRLIIYGTTVLFSLINKTDLIPMIYFVIGIDSVIIMLYAAASLIKMHCGFLELWHVIKAPLIINIVLFVALIGFVRLPLFSYGASGVNFIIGIILFSLIYIIIGRKYLKEEIALAINYLRGKNANIF